MKISLPKLTKPAPPRGARRRVPVKGNKRPPSQIKLNAAVARRSSRAMPEEEDYYDEQEPNMKLSHAFVVVLVLHVIAVAGVFAFNTIKTRQSPVFTDTAAASDDFAVGAGDAATVAVAESTDGSTSSRTFEPRGITEKPATQQTASEKVTAEFTGKTHQMAPGDTLTRLASIYGVSIAAIQAENGITDPTKIRVGEMIRIPAKDAAAGAAAAAPVTAATTTPATASATAATKPQPVEAKPVAAEAPAPAAASGDTYEVAAGDNPWSIAKKLNVSYQKLIEVNNIDDPTKIQIGQSLKIPAAN